jgi:hypothetical protein
MTTSHDSEVSELALLDKFLPDTQLEQQLNDHCLELFALSEIPYNPYPWLASKFQYTAERLISCCIFWTSNLHTADLFVMLLVLIEF